MLWWMHIARVAISPSAYLSCTAIDSHLPCEIAYCSCSETPCCVWCNLILSPFLHDLGWNGISTEMDFLYLSIQSIDTFECDIDHVRAMHELIGARNTLQYLCYDLYQSVISFVLTFTQSSQGSSSVNINSVY